MSNFFGGIQKLGRALMLPVAVLPAAALLLRLGAGDVLLAELEIELEDSLARL